MKASSFPTRSRHSLQAGKIDGNNPIELDRNGISQQKLFYVYYNPVESEKVDNPEEYKYSSTKEYAGIRKGFLAAELLC